MKKLLILWMMSLGVSSLIHAATAEAKVSSTEVIEGNQVTLRLIANGGDIAFPEITEIAGEPVISTSSQSSSSYTYVNGSLKSEQRTTKLLGFLPKKDMEIPSYTINVDGKPYQTAPISITLVKSKAPQMKKDAMYDFVLETDKKEVMVGESFILKLYITISNQIVDGKLDQLHDPVMDGFYVQEIGDIKQYRQKGNFTVEKQYLLTPNREGNLTIGSATVKLGERDSRRRDFFGRYGTQWYNIASNDLTIHVRSQPVASDLVGAFTLEASVDSTEVKANKPVNLTVTISGKGNLEDFTFPKYEIDGVSVFSDEAKVESSVVNGTLHSRMTKTFAMISDRDFTIPARTFSAFNPESGSLEKLEVPSYTIKVESDHTALAPTVTTTLPERQELRTQAAAPAETKVVKTIAWWMLVAAFFAGMSVMYLIALLMPKMKNKKSVYSNDEALQILYPHISESSEVEAMVRKLYAKKSGDKSVEIDKKVLKTMMERYKN